MLILTRQPGQKITFPELGISVEIIQNRGSRVRIGVKAPPEVHILRDELAPYSSGERAETASSRLAKMRSGTASNAPLADASSSLAASLTASGNAISSEELTQRLLPLVQQMSDSTFNLSLLLKDHECDATENEVVQLLEILNRFNQQLRQVVPFNTEKADQKNIQSAAPGTVTKTREQIAAELKGPSSNTRRRALIVDDNVNEAKLLASFLQIKNFDVETAFDGSQAMDYLMSHEAPDVVLLDMKMPQFDGRWAINAIRGSDQFQQLPVFAVSGASPQQYGVSFGPDGVDGWFQKPLDPPQLLAQLANVEHRPVTQMN